MRARSQSGKAELRAAFGRGRGLFLSIGLFSVFVNLLMLTGPLFMLQVYDRVLASRSEETLAALFLLVVILYTIMGVLDHARIRIAARIGARFQSLLDARVFEALLRRSILAEERARPATALRDLEAVQRFMAAPVLFAIFDIPWTPIFLMAIFIFHPWLGWLAVAGGLVLVAVTTLNQLTTRRPVGEAALASAQSDEFAQAMREEGELLQGLGMRQAVIARWQEGRDRALSLQMAASDRSNGFSAFSKSLRFLLQSAMLGLGAYLVIQGEMTAGAMIAASILMGRALAPVEQAIAGWSLFQRARSGWGSLGELLAQTPPEAARTPLPVPRALLDVEQITVVPPGEQVATLRMVDFRLEPGQALGIIGPSAAGKSSLARVLTGIWPPAAGKVRLDGATFDQYGAEVLGQHLGYLPQDVTIFGATVAENIARMAADPDPDLVVAAAKKAGAHEMILKLPQGYDTRIMAGGGRLSGGQKQRIGLARAMYGDPVLLVLDEPNSNLDADGQMALNTAIRAMKAAGKSVIIMAHRPAGIVECDLIMVLEGGMKRAFGPRDEVLRTQLKNHAQVVGAISGDRGGS